MPTGPAPRPIEDRFWSKVAKAAPDDCWPWTGSQTHGYGHLLLGGRATRRWKEQAHRLSYMLNVGPIPAGIFVLHSCDNPSCVNPKHLFLGTQLDNMRDAASKGRIQHPAAKKTHCKNGHPFAGDNLFHANNQRRCRTCQRAAQNRSYAKLRRKPR